jgi:hypothetical protein
MTRTLLLSLAVALGALAVPVRGLAAPDGSARAAVLEALALKADLPAARPVLPSLLTDPDAGQGGAAAEPEGARAAAKGESRGLAKGLARKAAKEAAEAEGAAAANAEAAKLVGQARADANHAAQAEREKKTREKHPKPPHPPKGGN